MAQPRNKSKVYGKQRRLNEFDFVAAFDSLTLVPTLPSVKKVPRVSSSNQTSSNEHCPPKALPKGRKSEETDPRTRRPPLEPSSANVERPTGTKPKQALGETDTDIGLENCILERAANEENPKAFKKDSLSELRRTARKESLTLVHSAKRTKKKERSQGAAELVRTGLPTLRTSTSLPRPALSNIIQIPEVKNLTDLPEFDCEVKMFDSQVDLWSKTFHIAKVGQGSYAAIFRLRLIADPSVYTIWKLMPLKPSRGKGSRAQGSTSIDDAIIELKALIAMGQSTGFVEYRSACILKGQLPEAIAKTSADWDTLHLQDQAGSDYISFSSEQIWLFVEMTDAGTDLEQLLEKGLPRCCHTHSNETAVKGPDPSATANGLRSSFDVAETWDIFWGVVQALAHGEEHAEFEHRDLHPGNICISNLSSHTLRGEGIKHDWRRPKFTNLEVTLIDYTLSRARLGNGEILANPMRDKSLFRQSSNIESDQAQYDMYRTMRHFVVGESIGRKSEPEKWNDFVPETNLLWLHHLLTILLKHTKSTLESHAKPEVVEKHDEHHLLALEMLEFLVEEIRPQCRPMWPWRSAKDLWSEAWFTEGFKSEEAEFS